MSLSRVDVVLLFWSLFPVFPRIQTVYFILKAILLVAISCTPPSIKRLTTTPYHQICNGLVEKFTGTLKRMLRRLCSDQPRQWHRFINPLLFMYREAPQEFTGFSPFDLLYGMTVRVSFKF